MGHPGRRKLYLWLRKHRGHRWTAALAVASSLHSCSRRSLHNYHTYRTHSIPWEHPHRPPPLPANQHPAAGNFHPMACEYRTLITPARRPHGKAVISVFLVSDIISRSFKRSSLRVRSAEEVFFGNFAFGVAHLRSILGKWYFWTSVSSEFACGLISLAQCESDVFSQTFRL